MVTKDETAQEVEKYRESPVEIYNRNEVSFSDYFDDTADEVMGNDHLKNEDGDGLLPFLVGIPFGITKFTFRHGFPSTKHKGLYLAYVSVEAVIADQKYLDARKKTLDGTPFIPGQHILFNDGGTGIYRDVVRYLELKGFITLSHELPEEGAKEESRFDAPPSLWTDVNAGRVWFDDTGFQCYEIHVKLREPRGLRKSFYQNENTGPEGATTFYLG